MKSIFIFFFLSLTTIGFTQEDTFVYQSILKYFNIHNDTILISQSKVKTDLYYIDFHDSWLFKNNDNLNKVYHSDSTWMTLIEELDSIKNPGKLKDEFSEFPNVKLLTENDIDGIFKFEDINPENAEDHLYQGWKRFYEKYGINSQLHNFSKIVYNKETTKAIVSLESYCGALCGEGNLIFLEKSNENWIVVAILPLFIA